MRPASLVSSRWTVPVAAVVTFALRMPGLTRPVRPDEAGWFLVARTWDPRPDSVYGPHFVDRPPSLVGLVEVADALGGPTALRVIAALGAAVTVLLAHRIGRMVVNETAGRWSAVVVAALLTQPLIDAVSASGELLALPLVSLAILLALHAVSSAGPGRASAMAFAAGLAGASAAGIKQSLVGGLVFAGVLVVGHRLWGGGTDRRLLLHTGGLLVGAATPVAATVGWALAAGVRLDELWYTVFGFRAEASAVLAASDSDAPLQRIGLLGLIALAIGVVAIIGGFLVHFRGTWHADRATAVATAALIGIELVGLFGGGSYWRDYLFPLVPGLGLCVALLMDHGGTPARRCRYVSLTAVAATAVAFVVWLGLEAADKIGYTEAATGEAVGAAASPGDSLTVFGGRADIQYTSGLPSPYPHLWSLPMRTMDPEYADLVELLGSPDAPTWLVTWVPLRSWQAPGAEALGAAIERSYVRHGTGCDDHPIYLRRGTDRPVPAPECD